MDKRPIGIFDSGLGGLTVVKEIRKILPYEDLIYLGDTARVPYGTRSAKVITEFALEDSRFLQKKNVKCIVIACNTASAVASKEIARTINVPIFEVISSGSADAVKKSLSGKIGVIATRGTVKSGAYEVAIKKMIPASKVYSEACPLLVPLIEEMETHGPLIDGLLDRYLKRFKNKEIDALILGCTHYPIITSLIKKKLGNIKLINPAILLTQNLAKFLKDNKMANSPSHSGNSNYFVTDLNERFTTVAEMFLGKKLGTSIKEVNLED